MPSRARRRRARNAFISTNVIQVAFVAFAVVLTNHARDAFADASADALANATTSVDSPALSPLDSSSKNATITRALSNATEDERETVSRSSSSSSSALDARAELELDGALELANASQVFADVSSGKAMEIVHPMSENPFASLAIVLSASRGEFGRSPSASAASRFATRARRAVIRPGTCACASAQRCACDGTCVLDEKSALKQIEAIEGEGGGWVMVANAPRASWMSKAVENDSRWIGEVAHPVEFAFDRMYSAAKHYFLSGDDEFAPVPGLLKCEQFTSALKKLRDECADARCATEKEDMRRYITTEAKEHIFTCDGFMDNPQTKHLRGTSEVAESTAASASRRTRAKYALLLPLGVGDEVNLVALSLTFGFKLGDLLYYRRSTGDGAYDVKNEPQSLVAKLEAENKIDAKLYDDVRKQMEELSSDPSFAPRQAALEAMLDAVAAFCEDHKVCSTGRAATDTIDVDAAHASILGQFPASCGTVDVAREIKCVDDWIACEGPGATGSPWYSSSVPTSTSTSGVKSTADSASVARQGDARPAQCEPTQCEPAQCEPTKCEPTKCEPTKCEPTKCEATKCEATKCVAEVGDAESSIAMVETPSSGDISNVANSSVAADATTAMAGVSAEVAKSDDDDDVSSDAPSKPKKSVADVAMKAAVHVHRRAPWVWYSLVFILVAVAVSSVAHARLVHSGGPASSLELGASIIRDRPVSAKEIGREMSANDEFWSGARPAPEPVPRARGTGRDSGAAGRRPTARGGRRGPMTAEERAFYDDL